MLKTIHQRLGWTNVKIWKKFTAWLGSVVASIWSMYCTTQLGLSCWKTWSGGYHPIGEKSHTECILSSFFISVCRAWHRTKIAVYKVPHPVQFFRTMCKNMLSFLPVDFHKKIYKLNFPPDTEKKRRQMDCAVHHQVHIFQHKKSIIITKE